MKIVPKERIKCGGEYHVPGVPCDVPDEVGKQLIEVDKAELSNGRPSGGKADDGKAAQGKAQGGKTDDGKQ